MKICTQLSTVLFLLTLALSSGSVYADEDDTMMVVDEGATPEDIVKVITLPLFTPANPQGKATVGQDAADQAKQVGKEFGQQVAEEAKAKGGSISNDVRQDARREGNPNRDRGRKPGG